MAGRVIITNATLIDKVQPAGRIINVDSAMMTRVKNITEWLRVANDIFRLLVLTFTPIAAIFYSAVWAVTAVIIAIRIFIDGRDLIKKYNRSLCGDLRVEYDGCNFYIIAARPTIIIGRGLCGMDGPKLITTVDSARWLARPPDQRSR